MRKRMTARNADKVLGKIGELIKTDKVLGKELLARLNGALDQVLDDDGFGTEGQLDPRGDHRD